MPDPFATVCSAAGPSGELFLLWRCQAGLAEGGNGAGQSMAESGAV